MKKDIYNAIVGYAKENFEDCFAIVTGHFVGMVVAFIERNGGDADSTMDININGGGDDSRDITIHSSKANWFVRVAGPDDVHGPMTHIKALRMAQEINESIYEHRASHEHPEFLPLSAALVKTSEEMTKAVG